MAQPKVFTPEKQQRFLDLVAAGCRPIRAGEIVSISTATLYRLRQNSPEFAKAWEEAEEKAAAPIEEALYEAARNGTEWAVKMWLHNRTPHRWKDQRRVQIEQDVTVNLEVGTSIERIAELRQLLEGRRQDIIEVEGVEVIPSTPLALPQPDEALDHILGTDD